MAEQGSRRRFIGGIAAWIAGWKASHAPSARASTAEAESASLVEVSLPPPHALRGGWAALAAVYAARGWTDDVYAERDQWLYHDGGGNWACLRLVEPGRLVLVGHDHEFSQTYFRESAAYFKEPETDLLRGAPEWWGRRLDPLPFGEWIGFVYGWEGRRWQRAAYAADDGFVSLDLLGACSIGRIETLQAAAWQAPGWGGRPPDEGALRDLVAADAEITEAQLQRCVPGWDLVAGVAAARRFREMQLQGR